MCVSSVFGCPFSLTDIIRAPRMAAVLVHRLVSVESNRRLRCCRPVLVHMPVNVESNFRLRCGRPVSVRMPVSVESNRHLSWEI